MERYGVLDEIDQQIVALLLANGRASHAEIGRSVGLTASSVYERVRKLEERGVILGYTAIVDPAKLGKPLLAFIRVSSLADPAHFEETVRDHPNVLECYDVTGEDSYIMRVRASDTTDLHQTIMKIRQAAAGATTITMIALHTVKELQSLPSSSVRLTTE
ncbi:MAG: Lrp/AsnC family transcriptional regulator [Anaerolineae bacterium]